jgi:aryl-alcohol dehydrogenase-like predicted oxidoreductase
MTDRFMRTLGDTGLTISALGLGTVKLGRDQGVKYPEAFRIPDDRDVTDLLSLTRELGINLIDTAPAYGTSEERLGQLLHRRDDWVICSKVGEDFSHGESRHDFRPEAVGESIERSLKRLNTDYIDIVLVHSDGNDLDIIEHEGTLEALDELKRRGLIRATGMSTKTVAGGLACLQKSDVAMVTYNLAHDEELPVIEYAHEHNKGILVKKAFGSGHLCRDGEDPVQASMNRILGTAGVSSIIAGTINPVHLRENVEKARRALSASKP